MSRTLTALFDDRQDAEAAKQHLTDASIGIHGAAIHDQSSAGHSSTDYSTHENRGFWDSVKGAFLPEEDRHTYEEGVRRGGFLLTAQVDENDADKAVHILENAKTVDIDERSSQWKSSGWDYQPKPAAATGTTGLFGSGSDSSDRLTGAGGSEESIPVVQEELKIGKREVERGGVRVRSYVVETPVHESVSLRDEHVEVERRAVNPTTEAGADAFRERTIEMTETDEEAVVAKDARVVEEVVVRKDVGQRTETVDDSVRRTEVDVEQLGTERGRSGFADRDTGTTGIPGGTTDRR